MSTLTVKTPTLDEMRAVAQELGFVNMSDADLQLHLQSLESGFEAYNLLDRMPDELPPVRYPRTPGRRPSAEENRYGAWYVKTEIKGAAAGKLQGQDSGAQGQHLPRRACR